MSIHPSYLSIHLSISDICLYIYPSINHIYLSIHPFIFSNYPSIHQSIISVYLSIHPSINHSHPSIHPSYLSIHPSIRQSYLSISVSICLPICPSMSIIYLSIIFVSSMYLLPVCIYLYYLSIVYPSISTCILLSIYIIYLLIICICTYTYICHPSLHPSISVNLSMSIIYLHICQSSVHLYQYLHLFTYLDLFSTYHQSSVYIFTYCCFSVSKSCPPVCNPIDCSMPDFPVFQYLPEFALNTCPLSWWCHLTISSSVVPFSGCLQSFPASRSFPRSQPFESGCPSSGASALASVLPMRIQA